MAAQKGGQKRTASKKTNAGQSRTNNKTTSKSTNKPASKTATAQKSTANQATKAQVKSAAATKKKENNQTRAVILFAIAILFGCLVLIKGDNLWNWTHNAILGVFGSWAIFGPILMIYVAVVTALEKSNSLSFKIWMMILVTLLFCTSGFVFFAPDIPANLDFVGFVQHLYENNSGVGGGVVGGMLGNPLIVGLGIVGARILVILLLFVSLMILTGTSLIQLFKAIKKPADVMTESYQTAKLRRDERDELALSADIDIPLESQLPGHPVHSDTAEMFPISDGKRKRRRKEKNEKLTKLNEVFGIENKEEQAISEGEDTAIGTESSDDEIFAFPINRAEAAETVDDKAELPSSTSAATIPDFAALTNKAGTEDTKESSEAAADAEKATAQFLKEHEESEKKETTKTPVGGSDATKSSYIFPPITLLEQGEKLNPAAETEELQNNGRTLVETLKSFGVQTKILDISRGPSVTRYELQPAAGVKISKITGLADDIAMNLAAAGVRIEAPIPGKAAVGIEVPNKVKNTVRLREIVESNSFVMAKSKLTVALGRDIAGKVAVADLGKMPHILIAGTTGSGKSVCINSLITSILYKSTPDEVRFLMIDPKVVELGVYNGIPHLLVPVVTDPRKASGALNWAVTEMLNRYKVFAECNVRDLESYNSLAEQNGFKDEHDQPMLKMPQIVIIIDELSDLMMAAPNEVEDAICRLAQMARAAGMHLVVATQRPSVDVVTGLIKANIPSRIAFAVSSQVDSRTILDGGGAEKLLGQGDMLFAPVGASKPLRIQGCFLTDSEIEKITDFVKKSKSIEYDETVINEIEKNAAADPAVKGNTSAAESTDPMLDEAIKCVVEAGQASTSLLQRRLRLGYARAGRLVDEMEQMGIVGPHEGSKPRQVLMTYNQWLEMNMQKEDE